MTTAAIMQPTYLGWLGYWNLLAEADVFVLLDTVPIDTRSWQVRNRIRGRDGNLVWLTVPTHAHRGDLIKDVRIDNTQSWQRKHWRTLEAAYHHAPYWDDVDNLLAHAYDPDDPFEVSCLAELTYDLIVDLSDYLGIDTPVYRSCRFPDTSDDRIERLADLCRHVNADTLIEPTGGIYLQGRDRLDDDIGLQWHNYHHPVYSQGDQPFCSHLSIVDLLAWHGPDSLSILRGDVTAAQPLEGARAG